MFERFTEQARQVLVLADEESRGLKHNYTGTEHILLGLLREEKGLAACVLEGLDITVDGIRRQVVQIVGSGEEVTSGQIPYTPRAKRVFERALHEAVSLEHNYISTEHILLALTRDNQGVAARILLDFDADSEKIRADVLRALSGERARPQGAGADAHLPPGSTSGELDALLDGAGALLGILVGEIEQRLGRPADAGDLLVALASIPGGHAARTLASVGVDAAALARAGDEARRSGARSGLCPPLELVAKLEKIRTEKEAAIQTAADLRDRERELTEQTRKTVEQRQEEALNEIRGRLGLTHE